MELYERMSELREINETLKAKKDALEATKKEDEDQIVKGTEWYKHSIRKKEVKRDGFHEKIDRCRQRWLNWTKSTKRRLRKFIGSTSQSWIAFMTISLNCSQKKRLTLMGPKKKGGKKGGKKKGDGLLDPSDEIKAFNLAER